MFRVIIRVVFLFAYGAFLYASLHHIAYFFHSFEQDGNNWFGSYALAIALDVTALVLTIGVMFFRKGMPTHALIGTWFFIFCLTGFSWLVNWEYAVQFQSQGLNRASGMVWVNPILASAFAFLNLAYSVVAEFFNARSESAEELRQKAAELAAKVEAKQQINSLKNQQLSRWISGKKQVFSEAFSAGNAPTTLEPTVPELQPRDVQEALPASDKLSSAQGAQEVERPDKYLMTFEEASRYTGYAISTLKRQLGAGEIEANKKGDKLKVSTLKIRSGTTAQMPAIPVEKIPATNGYH